MAASWCWWLVAAALAGGLWLFGWGLVVADYLATGCYLPSADCRPLSVCAWLFAAGCLLLATG